MKLLYATPLLLTACAEIPANVPTDIVSISHTVTAYISYSSGPEICGVRAPKFMPMHGCCKDIAFSIAELARQQGHKADVSRCVINHSVDFSPRVNPGYQVRENMRGAEDDPMLHAVAIIDDKFVVSSERITTISGSKCSNLW